MGLDEFTAVLKARQFVAKVKPTTIPVPVKPYLDEVGAILRPESDLLPDEPGWSFESKGKRYICVNARDREERQRFTICHEIAHFTLNLPSDHETQPWWSAKRPLAERLCDSFAAEVLLPDRLFRPLVEDTSLSLASIDELAARSLASTTATGFRFAAVVSTPCAFVLSEDGKVRYASRSRALVDAGAWIAPRVDLPQGTISERARANSAEGRGEIDAEVWFGDWERGGMLLEEARQLPKWDQTLTLLWFENGEVPFRDQRRGRRRWEVEGWEGDERRLDDDEPALLEELDGNLRWPSRRRRR